MTRLAASLRRAHRELQARILVRTAAEAGHNVQALVPLALPVSEADAERMAECMNWADEMVRSR